MATAASGRGAKGRLSEPLLCKWSGCEACERCTEFSSVEELARHVRICHVEPLESQDVVVCQWEKCKVYNVPSSSIQWLKRHVQQAHTKDRPFKCIMNGCIMAFNTREALQRHVNRHLEPAVSPTSSPPGSASPLQRNSGGSHKTGRGGGGGGRAQLAKRYPPPMFFSSKSNYHLYAEHHPPPSSRGMKIVTDSSCGSGEESVVRRPTSRRPLSLKIRIPRRFVTLSSASSSSAGSSSYTTTDVWDHKMMSVVRQTCKKCTNASSDGSPMFSFTLRAKIIGKRQSNSEDEVLVRWSPHLIDDCWMPISQFSTEKSVPLSKIREPYHSALMSNCFLHRGSRHTHRKRVIT